MSLSGTHSAKAHTKRGKERDELKDRNIHRDPIGSWMNTGEHVNALLADQELKSRIWVAGQLQGGHSCELLWPHSRAAICCCEDKPDPFNLTASSDCPPFAGVSMS